MQPPPPDLTSEAPRLADGRYVLLARLGAGDLAVVYAAWDTRAGAWVAIKVLRPPRAADEDLSRRFVEGALTRMALSSPHLVQVLDVGRDDGRPWIAMELVRAGSLHQWLTQHGAMPARLLVDAGRQLCQALATVHDAGAVHRGVHPRSALVDLTGTIKLGDPGVATRTGGFASPEEIEDPASADHRVDLYALGATLWTMLTAREPHELFRLAERPEMLDGVPIPLHDTLYGCLAPDREQRFGSAAEVEASLTSAWLALPQLPAGTPPLPLAIDLPSALDAPSRADEPDETATPDAPVADVPDPDEDDVPSYLAGVEQASGPLYGELIDGGLGSKPEPAPPAGLSRNAILAILAVLLGLALVGSAQIPWAAVQLTEHRDTIDAAALELANRARTAAPVLDELRELGGDPTRARAALDRLERAGEPRETAQDALLFLTAAEAIAAEVATSDRHEARLVRQRLDRIRIAREALAAAWTECRATSEGLAGRLALATGLASPACEPGGER